MFGETPRNKMLRKIPIHSCPRTSYLPILDSFRLEHSSLLRMHRNNFVLCRKVHNAGILKNTYKYLEPRIYMQDSSIFQIISL